MRIYLVEFNGQERLVEANVASQAVMHVAAGAIKASAARPQDVARVMAAGGKVESIEKTTAEGVSDGSQENL